MKTKINLTVEEKLVLKIKMYAEKNNTSVSGLVEDYFIQLAKPSKKSDLIKLVKSLPKTDKYDNVDVKKAYYEDNSSRYGF